MNRDENCVIKDLIAVITIQLGENITINTFILIQLWIFKYCQKDETRTVVQDDVEHW